MSYSHLYIIAGTTGSSVVPTDSVHKLKRAKEDYCQSRGDALILQCLVTSLESSVFINLLHASCSISQRQLTLWTDWSINSMTLVSEGARQLSLQEWAGLLIL